VASCVTGRAFNKLNYHNMPDRTLAIVFRNPHPQRSPIRSKLYLFQRDGSSVHIDYPHQGESIDPKRPRHLEYATNSCYFVIGKKEQTETSLNLVDAFPPASCPNLG
jgi:hypothetical protein